MASKTVRDKDYSITDWILFSSSTQVFTISSFSSESKYFFRNFLAAMNVENPHIAVFAHQRHTTKYPFGSIPAKKKQKGTSYIRI